MATSTTTNRRSRFVHPGQALPVPEDEDIYVSLQVLQTQLKTRFAPIGAHELLERVLTKVDKLQVTVDNMSGNCAPTKLRNDDITERKSRETLENTIAAKDVEIQVARTKQKAAHQQILSLQSELVSTKAQSEASHQKDMQDLRNQLRQLQTKVESHDSLEHQMTNLQIKVEQLASVQQEKAVLEDKYRIEQIQNNALLRRNWFLESENSKLKKSVSLVGGDGVKEVEKKETTKTKEEEEDDEDNLDYDTILFPIEDDVVANVRAILEREQREKTGHAARA